MTSTSGDVLREPLLSAQQDGRKLLLTLPGVLAALSSGEITSFPGLQVHQQHPWHAFLVQLAAQAFPSPGAALPSREEEWAAALLGLSGGVPEAWCLYVQDLKKPALLQPPFSAGESVEVLKNEAHSPDDLDILVTAKSHDVKAGRMLHPRPEHWLYALLSLQTMQGFSGRDNYGIARMNSGFGNRPSVSIDPGGLGARFRRDVAVCQGKRSELVQSHQYKAQGGLGLLWLAPWDGKTSLSLGHCDPFFVEICRRVRCQVGSALFVRYGSTSAPRIAAKELAGNTGDPWTPIEKKESNALTVAQQGFSYKLLQRLLLGEEFAFAPTQELQPNDPSDPELRCYALARGQGKTEGLHQRTIPIPKKARAILRRGTQSEREILGRRSKNLIEDIGKMENKVLRFSVSKLLTAGKEGIHDHNGRWVDAMDDAVDREFFDRLWDTLDEKDDGVARLGWCRWLRALAWEQLQAAIQSAPLPAARYYRAIAAAEGAFYGSLYKNFPDLKPNDAAADTANGGTPT